MSLLERLLNKGSVKVPGAVGSVYDSALGIGSWVQSGIEGYSSALAEWNAMKRYLSRFENIQNDPQALFYTLNSLLRQDPVKIPDHMSREDMNMIRSLISKGFNQIGFNQATDNVLGISNDSPTVMDINNYIEAQEVPEDTLHYYGEPKAYLKGEDSYKTPISIPEDNSGKTLSPIKQGTYVSNESESVTQDLSSLTNKEYYRLFDGDNPVNWLGTKDENGKVDTSKISTKKLKTIQSTKRDVSDPYEGVKVLNSPKEIKDYLDTLNFGYKTYAGFEIGTDHLWDIKMKPYNDNLNRFKSKFKELPSYYLPDLSSSQPKGKLFSFGDNLPAISYNLQYGNQLTKDIQLYNQSRIQIPVGFSYDMLLSLDIVDDVFHSMKKYLNQCINNIYDINNNEIAAYYQSAWLIDLTIYRSEFQINHRIKLIGCPVNYTPVYEGQSDPNATNIHLELAIVGIDNPPMQSNTALGGNNWESKTKWVDVILNPNN